MMATGRCVARNLFEDRWQCRIPEMYTYTKEFLAEAGMLSSGDVNIDRGMATNYRDMSLPIAALAIYFNEGARIELINREDATPIYNLIQEHLSNWRWVVQTQVNAPKPPIKDLRMLDDLATALLPMVNNQKAGVASDSFINRLNTLGSGMARVSPIDQPQAQVEYTPPKAERMQTPLADAIARRAAQRRS